MMVVTYGGHESPASNQRVQVSEQRLVSHGDRRHEAKGTIHHANDSNWEAMQPCRRNSMPPDERPDSTTCNTCHGRCESVAVPGSQTPPLAPDDLARGKEKSDKLSCSESWSELASQRGLALACVAGSWRIHDRRAYVSEFWVPPRKTKKDLDLDSISFFSARSTLIYFCRDVCLAASGGLRVAFLAVQSPRLVGMVKVINQATFLGRAAQSRCRWPTGIYMY